MKITMKVKRRTPLAARMSVMKSPVYPRAVEEAMLLGSDSSIESDMALRAFMIFEVVMPCDLAGKSFFAPGGDDALCTEAMKRGMTLDPPHDYILLYDVLDHSVAVHPIDLLRQHKLMLKPGGKFVVRCHPWCSRHATHIYRSFNRAYAHLMLTEQELRGMNLTGLPTRRDNLPPLKTYRAWFAEAGLKVLYEEPILLPPEALFAQKEMLSMMEIQDKSLLSIQFVDYILGHD
jgi:hypothetical protein